MSSRRSGRLGAGDKKSPANALKQLRELRESGKTNFHDYQVAEDVKIYDEVTETEFNALARQRMLEDDFIEDDTGEGYMYGGLEDWDRPVSGSSEDDMSDGDNDKRRKGKSAKLGSKGEKRKRDKKGAKGGLGMSGTQKSTLTDMLSRQRQNNEKDSSAAAGKSGKSTAGAKGGSAAASTDLLASIFKEMDTELESGTDKRARIDLSGDLYGDRSAGHGRSAAGGMSGFGYDASQPLVQSFDSDVYRRNKNDRTDFRDRGMNLSSKMRRDHDDHGDLGGDDYGHDADDMIGGDEPPASSVAEKQADEDQVVGNDVLVSQFQPPPQQQPQVKVRKLNAASTTTSTSGAGKSTKQSRPASVSKFLPKFEKQEDHNSSGSGALNSMVDTSGCVSWKSIQTSIPSMSNTQSGGIRSSQETVSQSMSANANQMNTDILEQDGSLLVYWFDATEKNGVVYLFGKTFHRSLSRYVSICITVRNVYRNMYVLPRPYRVDKASGGVTDIPVTMMDVYQEIDEIRKRCGVKSMLTKSVSRKYAFEMTGVPSESDYLKVAYLYTEPELTVPPMKNASAGGPRASMMCGETFSHIFGTTSRSLETFILKRRIMGPCWLRIYEPKLSASTISWCKIDCVVDNPKYVVVAGSDLEPKMMKQIYGEDCNNELHVPRETPPLVVMSIGLRTVMNRQKQVNEIVAASALVYGKVMIENSSDASNAVDGAASGDGGNVVKDDVPADTPTARYTVLRQLNDIPIPVELTDLCHRHNIKPGILSNERGLLNYLLATIYRVDPDILVGHNIVDYDLDVMLQRLKANNVQHWSRIGRLRRTVWPKLQSGAGGTGDSTYAERQIVAGRLLCDTYRSSQDLVRAKSYSLSHLSAMLLKIDRPSIDFDAIPTYFWDAHKLVNMIHHLEVDTMLSAQLMYKLQVVPLTKQLTCLAGNVWSRSLMGARAERNEWLLMHEFHGNKFVCPDKMVGGKGPVGNQISGVGVLDSNVMGDEGDADAGAVANPRKSGRRKAAYAGGLVLEPKRGFYDQFVLLLDFNSLYPSIIQEYNICFTTVPRVYDDDEQTGAGGDAIPDPPDASVGKGILPRLLATLVERRRAVKGLMKDPTLSSDARSQLDIRQKALKLTANSMYGCLGFSQSRFFAKPLAMLITSKGREILQNTVNLAEKMGLDVIYGDTDSIMIHTNTNDMAQVKKIGRELKLAVNKRYTCLEIEMDGVYQRLLLLNKKKYAAMVVDEEKDPKTGAVVSTKTVLETKGLDLVRRDWCGLSVDASQYVLQQLFSSDHRDDAVERIHQYLMQLGQDARAGRVGLQKYVINKSLTKAPEEYADRNSQPHVVVALQMRSRGLAARAGDTIPYVICKAGSSGDDRSVSGSSIAQRAKHPEDLARDGSMDQLDIEWYLSNQVLPPVARLFQPIEGTDAARLADCLGLDVRKYERELGLISGDGLHDGAGAGGDVQTLDSQLTDEERFRDVLKWCPKCIHCGASNEFRGVVRVAAQESSAPTAEIGFDCPNPSCKQRMPLASLCMQLRCALVAHMRRYLEQIVVCDDPACRTTTKSISVYGRRCLSPGCRGMVSLQYTDRGLYLQMQYFESLFDSAKMMHDLELKSGEVADCARRMVSELASETQQLRAIVEQYVSKNARRWVNLGSLFSFAAPVESGRPLVGR